MSAKFGLGHATRIKSGAADERDHAFTPAKQHTGAEWAREGRGDTCATEDCPGTAEPGSRLCRSCEARRSLAEDAAICRGYAKHRAPLPPGLWCSRCGAPTTNPLLVGMTHARCPNARQGEWIEVKS